jgi:hypothetical protein
MSPVKVMPDQLAAPKYAIWDLDNCLSDDRARIPLINWDATNPDERYKEYHRACDQDPPGNLEIFGQVGASFTPIFLTARPVWVRPTTVAWIKKHLDIDNPTLLMRNVHDHRASVDLKRGMVEDLAMHYDVPLSQIVEAFDDRPDIVRMYCKLGIDGQLLKIHDHCAYERPKTAAAALKPLRAPDILAAGAETFRSRNAVYGDTYLDFGHAMVAAFPDGLDIPPGDVGAMNRLGVFVQCMGKLMRYAPTLVKGGHHDSAHDLMVYGALLAELTPEKKS